MTDSEKGSSDVPRSKKDGRKLRGLMRNREELYGIVLKDADEACLEEVATHVLEGRDSDMEEIDHSVTKLELVGAMHRVGAGRRLIRAVEDTPEVAEERAAFTEAERAIEQERQEAEGIALNQPGNFMDVLVAVLTEPMDHDELLSQITMIAEGQEPEERHVSLKDWHSEACQQFWAEYTA